VSYQKGSIEKKGIGKYLLRYRVRDTRHPRGWRKVAELMEATTDKAAEKERDRRMRQVNAENETVTVDKQAANDVPTFGDFSKTLWMTYLGNKRVKQSTVDSYGSVLRHHVLPVFERKRLDEITPTDLSLFFDGLAQKLSTKFILNIYALLRVMFEVAVEYDLIEINPVRRKLHRPRHQDKKKPALSAEQIRVFLDNVPLLWKAFFLCLALTNLRIGELLALQWGDVDWNDRKLRISKSVYRGRLLHSTKTEGELSKHLPETLFRVLEWHRQRSHHKSDSDFLFCKFDGSPCDPNFVRDSVLSRNGSSRNRARTADAWIPHLPAFGRQHHSQKNRKHEAGSNSVRACGHGNDCEHLRPHRRRATAICGGSVGGSDQPKFFAYQIAHQTLVGRPPRVRRRDEFF